MMLSAQKSNFIGRPPHGFDPQHHVLNVVLIFFLSREDLPTDLTLNLDLHKITPFPMTVPCLNGVGSCEYEVLITVLVILIKSVALFV